MNYKVDSWTPVERDERYYIGLDLGYRQDYTALAVISRTDTYHAERNAATFERIRTTDFRVRKLARAPLNTEYPEIVRRVANMLRHPEAQERSMLVVDATGVGTPVVQMFQKEKLGVLLTPVMITPGERESRHHGTWHVPKKVLIMGLQVMVQERTLRVARKLELSRELIREMQQMRRCSFQGWRSGAHDDLVLAVALAAWAARREAMWWVR